MAIGDLAIERMRRGRPRAARSSYYSVLGLVFRSEIALPLRALAGPSQRAVDFVIRRAGMSDTPIPDDAISMWSPCADLEVRRAASGTWIAFRQTGICYISTDARQAVFYAAANADESSLGLAITGAVAVFVLHRRHRSVLHASAIVHAGRAALFLGAPGRGKSTLVAGFLKDGVSVLGDDTIPVRDIDGVVYAEPSVPFLKILPDTADRIFGRSQRFVQLLPHLDKKALRLEDSPSYARRHAPVAAVYLLDRVSGTGVSIHDMARRDALAALIAHTSFRYALLPREQAELLPMYSGVVAQAPVRVLRYAHGIENQAEVRAAVITDLRDRT